MCGNSPATTMFETHPLERKDRPGLFIFGDIKEKWDHGKWVKARKSPKLQQTCLICPFADTCDFAIPSRPYYRKGLLQLRPRHKVMEGVGFNHLPLDPSPNDIVIDPEILTLLHQLEPPVPA